MRITTILAGAATLALAVPASAQVVGGGLGGQVGGGVQVNPGATGLVSTVRDLGREAGGIGSDVRGLARDQVEYGRDRSRDARAGARADGSAEAGRSGVTVDFNVGAGATVTSNRGDSLGQVVSVVRGAQGQAQRVLVRGADGVTRAVDARSLTADASGGLTADLTAYQFRRLPESSSETADNARRSPSTSGDAEIY